MAQTEQQAKQAEKSRDSAPGVASMKDNESLEHSVDGVTTRSDALDLGVPMLPGDPAERQGPEDALGAGPKRGDYSERQPEGSLHFESVLVEGGGEPILDGDGNVVDYTPRFVPVFQNPRASDQGEVPKLKGGVDTDEDSKAR